MALSRIQLALQFSLRSACRGGSRRTSSLFSSSFHGRSICQSAWQVGFEIAEEKFLIIPNDFTLILLL
jgi:hypothetical protein